MRGTQIKHKVGALGASRIAAVAIAAAGLAVTAAAGPANAAVAGGESTRDTVHSFAASEQSQVESYWTEDRMRGAVPIEKLIGVRDVSSEVRAVERGVPTVIGPKADVTPKANPEGGAPWEGGGEVTKTTGRVFFKMGGRDASCSGNAVTSENKSTVITAGHCVKYQGNWHTDWVFVPGYDNGERPHGTWPATKTLSTPQWVESEDINYDVGAAVVDQVDGKSLTDAVGAQAIAFNIDYNLDMYAFGFPAADPYDGEKLIYCSGTTFKDFLLSNDHGLACDMTGGSSGGPWFTEFDEATGTGAQASVNSFGYNFLPGNMFGPYFGAEAQDVYNEAQATS